jgi:hypothetical protein
MRTRIGIIGVLIQEAPVGVLLRHFNCSSDRTIREYAEQIWGLSPVRV